jgi:hypothetical protein
MFLHIHVDPRKSSDKITIIQNKVWKSLPWNKHMLQVFGRLLLHFCLETLDILNHRIYAVRDAHFAISNALLTESRLCHIHSSHTSKKLLAYEQYRNSERVFLPSGYHPHRAFQQLLTRLRSPVQSRFLNDYLYSSLDTFQLRFRCLVRRQRFVFDRC